MTLEEEVSDLLSLSELQDIEKGIALKMNCEIYDSPLIFNTCVHEVMDSEIAVEEISTFLVAHQYLIMEFGSALLLANGDCDSISRGTAVKYAIYLIYIEKMPEQLLQYLNRRRIPKTKKVAAELIAVKKAIHI